MPEHDLRPIVAVGAAAPGGRAPIAGSFGPTGDLISRVAETEVGVLLRGERGTGKELVARAIHAASRRRDRVFVKIDCATSRSVLEAELFGCERGAVGGVGQHRPGRLEFANRGTLFLDHINALPAPLQAPLQQVLEARGFARRESQERVPADVRVIASSEVDLERAVAAGRFDETLFVRLKLVCLTLPPLRQRRRELRELAEFFVRRYAVHYNKPAVPLSAETLRLFAEHRWPSNLHELEAIVKRIVMLGHDGSVREDLARASAGSAPPAAGADRAPAVPSTLPPEVIAVTTPVPLKAIGRQAADGAERELIYRTLQRTRWNRRAAAQMLGVSYKALLYKIKRAELEGGA